MLKKLALPILILILSSAAAIAAEEITIAQGGFPSESAAVQG